MIHLGPPIYIFPDRPKRRSYYQSGYKFTMPTNCIAGSRERTPQNLARVFRDRLAERNGAASRVRDRG